MTELRKSPYCPHCDGQGAVHTGILELGASLCEPCEGTGYHEQAREALRSLAIDVRPM